MPAPLRVLHVIPSLDLRDGGPSVVLPAMAKSVAAHGIAVEAVATLTDADAATQGIAFGEPVARDGFTARFFRRQTGFYKVSLPLRSWVRRHARDFDLLHIHALFSQAPLVAARAARRAGVPYLMRPLGLLNAWGMENRRPLVKALSFRWLDRPALEHAAAIHYTSTDERDEAARLGLRPPAVVIPLGIDLAPFQSLPAPDLFLSRHETARGRDLILFLSRLDPKKGLDHLLPEFAKLRAARPNTRLVIAGGGDAAYVASLQAAGERLGIAGDVIWTGALQGEMKLAAFAAARVFVLPSHSENFGIALLEAMACGLPCVSTAGVALAREAGDAVRLAGHEPGELGAALQSLLDSEPDRRALGGRAAALAREKYSLEAMGGQLATLYHQISSRRAAGSSPLP